MAYPSERSYGDSEAGTAGSASDRVPQNHQHQRQRASGQSRQQYAQQQRHDPRRGPPPGSSGPPTPSSTTASASSPQRVAASAPVIAAVPSTVSSVPTSAAAAATALHQPPQHAISVESPLPPVVQRCLGDRSYDKRKNAALEIEALVKSLQETNNAAMIQSVVAVLSKDFCTSMNANYRKGGLIGIAATAIGLMGGTRLYLDAMLPPVLHCFDDPEARVRYYACESLYNIAKVARTSILRFFNQIFDGLTKLFADVDVDVKNGANLLDRLIKDIVTESDRFDVEQFLPLLQNYIRRTNPYIRQLLVGWITVLDSVPDISMIDYLPDFLDGLFNMLSDSNREIRQAADSALSDFLREVRQSTVVEFGPMVSVLVSQCHSKERLNRLTAITWLAELIHHPHSGGDALLPYHSEVLGAIVRCISDGEAEIRRVSEQTDADLLAMVRDTAGKFELSPLLDTLTSELVGKDDVPTKMAALRWINMLLEKRKGDMAEFIPDLLPVLLRQLSDDSDAVVILTCQVLSRISLSDKRRHQDDPAKWQARKDKRVVPRRGRTTPDDDDGGEQFQMVLNAILGLFASDRHLLEARGSLIVRKLCVLLNAKSVYIRMAETLSSSHSPKSSSGLSAAKGDGHDRDRQRYSLEFISTMVQTLNLILLTAPELHGLRSILAEGFVRNDGSRYPNNENSGGGGSGESKRADSDGARVFSALFRCWCHDPVATFSLCLLARAYDVAFALVKRFSSLEVTVGFLMRMDKLVQLLESPIFVHLRLQLLDVESPDHAHLLKSCYGILMLLPQSDAFRILNDRLAAVCNLRDNLGVSPRIADDEPRPGSDTVKLLMRFDEVTELHRRAGRERRVGGGGGEVAEPKGAGGGGGKGGIAGGGDSVTGTGSGHDAYLRGGGQHTAPHRSAVAGQPGPSATFGSGMGPGGSGGGAVTHHPSAMADVVGTRAGMVPASGGAVASTVDGRIARDSRA